MPLLLQYEELFQHDKHVQHILVLIYEDILMFHTKVLCFVSGRGESERSTLRSSIKYRKQWLT